MPYLYDLVSYHTNPDNVRRLAATEINRNTPANLTTATENSTANCQELKIN